METDLNGDGEGSNEDKECARRRRLWLIGLLVLASSVGVLVFLVLVVWLPPHLLDTHGLGAEARLKAENDLRGTLAAVVGGLAVLGGSVIAAVNLRHNRRVLEETERQNREAARQNRETLEVARRGQVTERFTKAIEQLGQLEPENLSVRLGGIYALEQIALDSEQLHWPTVEVLTAFLRENSKSLVSSARPAARDPTLEKPPTDHPAEPEGIPPLRADLQAVATVLGRRPEHRRLQEARRIDLRRVRLPRVHLHRAQLQGAFLWGAQLQGANLRGAYLKGTILRHADLGPARSEHGNLRVTDLRDAHLEEADLRSAHLERANLRDAHLDGADLSDAHLQGADLSATKGLTPQQLKFAVLDQMTQLPPDFVEAAPDAGS